LVQHHPFPTAAGVAAPFDGQAARLAIDQHFPLRGAELARRAKRSSAACNGTGHHVRDPIERFVRRGDVNPRGGFIVVRTVNAPAAVGIWK